MLSRAQAGPTVSRPDLRLPPPSPAVVLRWDRLGGLRASHDGGDEPALLLHADGRYSAPPATLGGARRSGQLSRAELRALLEDIVHRLRFAEIDARDIQTRMQRIATDTGRLAITRDGGVTRIELTLPDLQHRVELPNLHASARSFPEIDALQRLLAIQQRLLELAQTAR